MNTLIKESINITDVLAKYGYYPNSKGYLQCPLHSEKTPSFKIYPKTNSFYCFGCGAGGDVIKLVQVLFGISYPQAVLRLKSDFDIMSGADPDALKRAQEERNKRAREEAEKQARLNKLISEHRYLYHFVREYRPKPFSHEAAQIYSKAKERLGDLEYILDRFIVEGERYEF